MEQTKVGLPDYLPKNPEFIEGIRRAPKRNYLLNKQETALALKNAIRYIPDCLHEKLIPEFLTELKTKGRVYGYRYRPHGNIKAKPITEYKGIIETRAIQVMLNNNLDFAVALYPYELVTYGESGQVCQNWMQYRIIVQYLEIMTEEQTLFILSGHPLGIFPTNRNAPRVISTNGLIIGSFDNSKVFNKIAALGVTNYGQMTAGGWMYIGPQGIVHGTYITTLNAGRKYLGLPDDEDLRGTVILTSGLGGMSGAQPKAFDIAGAVSITAEVDISRIKTRLEQGWVMRVSNSLDEVFSWVDKFRKRKEPLSIAYHGNVVDVWQYVVEKRIKIDLGTDQTSCHAVYEGGYTPQGLTYKEGRNLLNNNLEKLKLLIDKSLRKQFELIQTMSKRGTFFYDYGNSFLKAVFDAGVKEIAIDSNNVEKGFIFPSYVEDIMGPICFDYGYGPFRWVCLSGKDEDLEITDRTAMECINPKRNAQDRDNYFWIKNAKKNKLVVGSKARILYSDAQGRTKIALKFNQLVKEGKVGPIMLGRDHHDVSGTDSPFRETSNIYDGSNVTADMAHHSWGGNIAHGMTMCVLSNGGGVGIGKAYNGGFSLVLDGSRRVDDIISSAIDWDVTCGVARRAWGLSQPALETAKSWNHKNSMRGNILLPKLVKKVMLDKYLQ